MRVVPGAADYYNLTVSNLHTFTVGAGRYVVHNCGDPVGRIEYGSSDLSKAARARRVADADKFGKKFAKEGNYGAARLEDGSLITGRSMGKGGPHAEQDLIGLAESRGKKIVSLYSEREPCATRCAGLLNQHNPNMRISWSWRYNGVDDAGRSAIGKAIRAELRGWI